MPAVRRLRMNELLARYPYSVPSIYRLMSEGKFPRPDKIGPRAVAWNESVLDEYDRQIALENQPAE